MRHASRWFIPLGLCAATLALYVYFPAPGYRAWDAWMTASVIHDWPQMAWREVFFFAHPLVLPITRLFDLVVPTADALFLATIRESTFAALNVALCAVLFGTLLRDRLAGLAVAAAFAAAYAQWQLATSGEEKASMNFGALLVTLSFFHLRGWIRIGCLDRLSRCALALSVGAAMALAFAVHLENGFLPLFVLLATVCRGEFFCNWRSEGRELVAMFTMAGLLVLAFFLPIAFFANGIRDVDGLVRWLLEYHLMGQGVSIEYRFLDRVAEAYGAFRSFVVGPLVGDHQQLECGLAIASFAWACRRAWRTNAAVTVASGILIGLMTLHFFNYRQEPEAWAGVAVPGLTILALATLGKEHPRWLVLVWLLATAGLAVNDAAAFRAGRERLRPLVEQHLAGGPQRFGPLARRFQAGCPEAHIAFAVDRQVDRNTVILVARRHLASALLVYTDRDAIVVPYLDRQPEYFTRPNVALTILSRHFYIPQRSSADIAAATATDRSLFYLDDSPRVEGRTRQLFPGRWSMVHDLGFGGYRLFRRSALDVPDGR